MLGDPRGVLGSLRQGQQTQVSQGPHLSAAGLQRREFGLLGLRLPALRLPAPPPVFQQPGLNTVVRLGEQPSSAKAPVCTCMSVPCAPGCACWGAESDTASVWPDPVPYLLYIFWSWPPHLLGE